MSTTFTFLDWALLLIFLISLFLGIMKGLVRELFSLGFLILGAALAYRLYSPFGRLLQKWIKEDILARFLAFMIILLLVVVIGIWVTWLVKKIFIHGAVSIVDRVLGGVLGAVRGILFCCVLLVALVKLPVGQRWIKHSLLGPLLVSGMEAGIRMLPENVEKKWGRYFENVKQENIRNRGTI